MRDDPPQGSELQSARACRVREHTPSEYKAIIARADMVVAERMHAAIAAFSSGACALCVGYSVKARGIVDGFLGEGAAAEGWVVPVADFVIRPKRSAVCVGRGTGASKRATGFA